MRRLLFSFAAGLIALGVTGAVAGCGGSGGGGGPSAPPPAVLIVHAMIPDFVADLQGKLTAFGFFPAVDAFDAGAATPTLVDLQAYDALLVVSDFDFSDSVALGDVVADYIDAGGAVVLSEFTISDPGTDTLEGRFATDDYYVIPRAPSNGGDTGPFGMLAFDGGHPIFDGVSSFAGGTNGFRPEGSVVPAAYNLLAVWDDGASTPLVATRGIGGVLRADLGFFPVTDDAFADGLDASTDAMRIVANTLLWTAGSI